MRLGLASVGALLLSNIGSVVSKSSWSFNEATLSIQSKGTGAEGVTKEKLAPGLPITKSISLGSADTLKIILTTTEDKKPKRAHQVFLKLLDPATGLEDSFPLSVKENGKGKIELTHKDLPIQLLLAKTPLRAFLVIASFGSATPLDAPVFDLGIDRDPSIPLQTPERALRYGKLEEIHHIFHQGETSGPLIITLIFTGAVLATPIVLVGVWLSLGLNFDHIGEAFSNAPVSHALFMASIMAMEGLFMMYYISWNLFQTLPIATAIGSIIFFSGSKALTEVQNRRLASKR